MNVFVSVASDS